MDLPARQQPSARQPKARLQTPSAAEPIAVGVNAAIFAVQGDEPVVAVVPVRREERSGDGALPSGLFSPRQHEDLETALRALREAPDRARARLRPADLRTLVGRHGSDGEGPPQSVPVALPSAIWRCSPPDRVDDSNGVSWRSWYAYFPWEDWRRGKPACLTEEIEPRLQAWARLSAGPLRGERAARSARPTPAPAHRVRLRWRGLGRGEGAGALRASGRGRPSRRARLPTPAMLRPHRLADAAACGTPCSAITPGCWPAPSARCGAASNCSR